MAKYGKSIVAVIVAAVVVAYQALSGDGIIEMKEWVSILIAFVTAVGVYLVPLAPSQKYGKSAVAAVLAVLQILTTLLLDGFGADDVMLMFITAAGALGIWAAPARSQAPSGTVVAVTTGSDR